MTPNKTKKSIVLKFTIAIAITITVFFSALVIYSVKNVSKSTRKIYSMYTEDMAQAYNQGINYRNSKFTQQLRMYSTAEIISTGDIEAITTWLANNKRVRSKDFKYILFVDKNGNAYFDDPDIAPIYFYNTETFNAFMLNGASQYISNPTKSVLEDEYIAYVARTATHNGDVIGFFAGAVSVEDIHKAVSIMEPGDTGFAFLLDGFGNVMSHEQEELIMKVNFTQGSEDGYEGLSDIAQSMI